MNQRFRTDFDAQDLVDGVTDQLVADEGLQKAARLTTRASSRFQAPLVSHHEKHGVFQEEALGAFFRAWMLDQVDGRLASLPA